MPRLYNYTIVDTLPDNAVKVSEYAKQRGFTYPYIYEQFRKVRENVLTTSQVGFEIVTFQGINFIIPLT